MAQFFTIKELCASNTAKLEHIDNTPDAQTRENMIAFIEQILDPIRIAWKGPICVSSGYRCPDLNRLVGGSAKSHHLQGLAADLYVKATLNMSQESNTRKLFLMIISRMPDLPFCQCIYEVNPRTGSKWVHISFEPNRPLVNGRKDSLDARRQVIDGLMKR